MLHTISWITLLVLGLVAGLLLWRASVRRARAERAKAAQPQGERRAPSLLDYDFDSDLHVPEDAAFADKVHQALEGKRGDSSQPSKPVQPPVSSEQPEGPAPDASPVTGEAMTIAPSTPVVDAAAATATQVDPAHAVASPEEKTESPSQPSEDSLPPELSTSVASQVEPVAPPMAERSPEITVAAPAHEANTGNDNDVVETLVVESVDTVPASSAPPVHAAADKSTPNSIESAPVQGEESDGPERRSVLAPVAEAPSGGDAVARPERKRPVTPAKPTLEAKRPPAPKSEASDGRRVRYAFNMGALPGIAYIGKHLEPKLAFQRMEGGGTVLRVATGSSTMELPLPPSRLIASLRAPLATDREEDDRSGPGKDIAPRPEVAGSPGLPAGTSAFIHSEHARVVEQLSHRLQRQPEDLSIRRRLSQALLAQAGITVDEMDRARLLDMGIDHLEQVHASGEEDEALLVLLGQACHNRAQIGPSVDPDLLRDAEAVLRKALNAGALPDSDAAWLLQQTLQAAVGTDAAGHVAARLQEAQDIQLRGLASKPADMARWQVAVMRTELLVTDHVQRNVTARRLHLRQLHAKYHAVMQTEQAPSVLEAWVDMLCVMAESSSGTAASERYAEAESIIARLPSSSTEGLSRARAMSDIALSRVKTERVSVPAALLAQAEAALAPYLEQEAEVRLRAARIALALAQRADASTADASYRQAAELAVPLTSVPSLAMDASRVVLASLLALGDTRDHGVYARCLAVLAGPEDVESLWLLAQSAFREGRYAEGCRHCEQAWRVSGAASPAMVEHWQQAQVQWAMQDGNSAEVLANLRHLRMARARRGAAA